jgi:monoamine oxidase
MTKRIHRPRSNTGVDVAVVGGGAAGIGAARRLARAGLTTMILEADSRLGGRAWTREHRGLRIDLGCGWLHSAERNSWISIAAAAGIPIDRSAAKWGVQFRDLGFPPAEQAAARAAFGSWMQRLANVPAASDRASDALIPGCEWNEYIRIIGGFISGARLERLSVADYRAYDDASTEDNWRVPSGFGALIANTAPGTLAVHVSTPVTALELANGGVELTTAAGTVRARAAILTVSTSVLAGDAVDLPANLAPWREAAASLPLGRNEKLFLEIVGDSPFEAESQVLGNPRDSRSASHYIRPFGIPVIESFFGGEGASMVEEGGAVAGFDFAIAQLVSLFGSDVRKRLRPLAASDWSRMPNIGGSYSYALPGHASARAALARSFDNRVFFAGEATNASDFSTAHGAYDSGGTAAAAVITAIG